MNIVDPEILNYKTDDKVYYGPIENVKVYNKGVNYDVINPPLLSITDSVGSGATGTCSVKGIFKDIKILDSGFDYKKPVAKFLHIDCDVYSSTVDIFNTLEGKVVPGTVIVFDDYCNYTGWRKGEYKAWQDFKQKQNLNYEYLDLGGMAVSLIVR